MFFGNCAGARFSSPEGSNDRIWVSRRPSPPTAPHGTAPINRPRTTVLNCRERTSSGQLTWQRGDEFGPNRAPCQSRVAPPRRVLSRQAFSRRFGRRAPPTYKHAEIRDIERKTAQSGVAPAELLLGYSPHRCAFPFQNPKILPPRAHGSSAAPLRVNRPSSIRPTGCRCRRVRPSGRPIAPATGLYRKDTRSTCSYGACPGAPGCSDRSSGYSGNTIFRSTGCSCGASETPAPRRG